MVGRKGAIQPLVVVLCILIFGSYLHLASLESSVWLRCEYHLCYFLLAVMPHHSPQPLGLSISLVGALTRTYPKLGFTTH